MKRWMWGVGAVVVILAALWAWPLASAARLAAAVRSGDATGFYDGVDVDALRRSFARQIARAYLTISGKGGKLGALGQNMAGAAITTVVDPYVAQLLTPENLTALLGQGRLDHIRLGDRTVPMQANVPKLESLLGGNLLSTVTGSYYDSLRDFVIPIESDTPADTYGVHMRLDGLVWKLGGVDLPAHVVADLARSIVAGEKQAAEADATVPRA